MAAFTRADLIAATEDFQACVDRDPNDSEAWYYLGMAALPRNFKRARAALDHALSLAPDHHGILYWRAEADWVDGNPGSAAQFLRRLNEIAPGVPQNLARQGLAHLAAGETGFAVKALNEAANAGDGLAGVNDYHPELRRAIYLDLLGRREEASTLIRAVNGGGISSGFAADRYPHDLEKQRCTLENVVAGRDIVILGSGPSLEALPALLKEIGPGGCDRLCFFGFNNVPVAERMLRDTIGRGVDLACMTSAGVMELHLDWIGDFLARESKPNLFLTLTAAVPPKSSLEDLLNANPDKLYYFAANADYPPIPEDPLHFPPINTLMCVLPLAVLARPRRIFMFGCDGAATISGNKDATVYFRQGSAEYGKQLAPAASEYASWLARDTFFFNALIPTVIDAFSVLHRAPVPPILICNPDSAYRPFPRISNEDFLRLRGEPVADEHIYPARIGQLQRQIEKLQAQMAAGAAVKSPLAVLKKQAGQLRRQAGRVKRFAMTRGMSALRRLAQRLR